MTVSQESKGSTYPSPYLSNTKAPAELLGLAVTMNPFPDHTSAQRLTMWSGHSSQAQVLHGSEIPRIMTGFETLVGDYEYSTTERDCGIQIIERIPKYITNDGATPIKGNPYYTIIYRREDNGQIGYFNLEAFTMRADGYGFPNRLLNVDQLNKGNYIPKEMKLSTSPSHEDDAYKMGTNLRTAYISLPHVTEDAFIISESAAKKLSSDGYGKISFKITPNQIPINLYGDPNDPYEYKFLPDIGEKVSDNGILCALRTPTDNSFIYDTAPRNLRKIQHLHDNVFYVPVDSEVVDIDVVINRNCRLKAPKAMYSQVDKYRDAVNVYYHKIWNTYLQLAANNEVLTPEFSNLVTTALTSLMVDGERVPGYTKKARSISAMYKKETIEFIYITITYKYTHKMSPGFKLTGRYGNKGTVCKIIPDEQMPKDDTGMSAQICVDPISVFNRMNPSQWYEQFINRAGEMVRREVEAKVNAAGKDPAMWESIYAYALEFINDINPKWAELINRVHVDSYSRKEFVKEIANKGFFLQISPFQDNIDPDFVLKIKDKYHISKTPVEFDIPTQDGTLKHIRTAHAVMIGDIYWYLLYKMPHMRCCNVSYVNQNHCPMRANGLIKLQTPFSQNPNRLGEDEIRNMTMTAGPETSTHILGAYANSATAVENLTNHLLTDEDPGSLYEIDMNTAEIIKDNSIVGIIKHIFSCAGIDIAPTPEEVARISTQVMICEDESALDDGSEDEEDADESDKEED